MTYRGPFEEAHAFRARVRCTIAFLLAAIPAFSAEIQVKAGESIQAAIDTAVPGDTITVAPGVYNESLTIRIDDLTLRAHTDPGRRAVLDGHGAELEMMRIEADDIRIEGFVVRNAMAAGVVVFKSQRATLSDLIVEDNSFIGINISDSTQVTVDTAACSGHASAGILVAQSSQVRVVRSDSYDNLTGIRIENSDSFVIENNTLYRNSTGIAAFTIPDRSKPRAEYGLIAYNRILDNNRDSTADPATVDSAIVPGVGLYVVAADHLEVAYNRFERNQTYAALTVGLPNSTLPIKESEEDPTTDHLYVHHNRYAQNGTDPSSRFAEAFPDQPAGDLYWDETGERNQWQESGEFRTVPEKLVQQQGGAHTNVIHFI